MSDGNPKPATPDTAADPLDESINRYGNALSELESATQNHQNPSIEQIVEVLVARDVVEKQRVEAQNLSGQSIAKLIELDKRLKKQRLTIAAEPRLSEGKEYLNIPPTNWWWQLTDSDAIPNKVVKRYEETLSVLEAAVKNHTQTPEEIRKVLLDRDAVEQICREEKEPPQESIDRIMHLDERLWKLAGAIAKEEKIDQWKVHFNPPVSNWWWHISTESPSFIQCVERYQNALTEMKHADDPSPEQALKLLKTRDVLEKAIQNQPSLPEGISHRITELDQELKQQRLALTRRKQLQKWKKSLNPPSSNWWWNFKPTLFGDEEEPLPWRDRVWILGALVCIGIAAGFVINTTQTFQSGSGKEQNRGEVRSDAAQNSLVILQGLGLLATGGTVVTKKGQKILENLIISIPFLRPSWQAPATFCLSLTVLGVAYGINASLPTFGDWYFDQGEKLEEENQLFQAQEKYLQARKFFIKADDKAKLSLLLGKVYEQQGNLNQAIEVYKNALTTDNTEVMICLGRAMILSELKRVGVPNNKIKFELLQEADIYLKLVENKLKKSESQKTKKDKTKDNKNDNKKKNEQNPSQEPNIQTKELKKELLINQAILDWSKGKLNSKNSNLLEEAKNKFKKAKELEDELPTTTSGRKARCYLELVGIYPGNLNCEKILNSANDINETSLISEHNFWQTQTR